MDQQLVSAWLQLPLVDWPPDHYTLLGLKSGEADVARIEQQVYQRMEIVRRYQLTHPELATEVMNRLAQALVCLTDPAAKSAYDALLFPGDGHEDNGRRGREALDSKEVDPLGQLLGRRGANGAQAAPAGPGGQREKDWRTSRPAAYEDWQTAPPAAHQAWQTAPPPAYPNWETTAPPVRHPDQGGTSDSGEPSPSSQEAPDTDGSLASAALQEQTEPGAAGAPAQELPAPPSTAQLSAVPSGRLRNRRALFARIARLRQLLWAWQRAGEFLKQEPTRVINRPADAMDLMAAMHAIRELLRQPPSLLGNAGEAGYHVQTLARQEDIVPRLKKMSPPQRESLARDWQAGYEFLLENRRLLRQELREHHSRGLLGKVMHFLGAALSENVGLILFVLAVVAVNLAFQDSFPELRSLRMREIAVVLIIIVAKLVWWWNSFRPLGARLYAAKPRDRRKPVSTKQLGRQTESSGAKAYPA